MAGSRLQQRVKRALGSSGDRTLDVTTVEAPDRLGFAGAVGPSPMKWGFDLTANADGRTEVVLWIEAEPRGLMRGMPSPLLRSMFRHVNDRELAAIKAAVEQPAQ